MLKVKTFFARNICLLLIITISMVLNGFTKAYNGNLKAPSPPAWDIVRAQSDSIEQLWISFINSRACIGGFQYVNETSRPITPNRLAFNRHDWSALAKKDPKVLTEFLMIKFDDTTKTTLHVCPFFQATTGEMAVYALQQIHKINWYDFKEFNQYKDRDYLSASDQPQMWLRSILSDQSERKKLEQLFLEELKK
ncbi:MAG: hypothetical protein ABJM06_06620 [Gilvibacter sp.]